MPLIQVVHVINPSPKEEYKVGGGRQFSDTGEVRASGWIFYFLDLPIEPQFRSLSFISCAPLPLSCLEIILCYLHC